VVLGPCYLPCPHLVPPNLLLCVCGSATGWWATMGAARRRCCASWPRVGVAWRASPHPCRSTTSNRRYTGTQSTYLESDVVHRLRESCIDSVQGGLSPVSLTHAFSPPSAPLSAALVSFLSPASIPLSHSPPLPLLSRPCWRMCPRCRPSYPRTPRPSP
jgi:hypothetical protein